MCKNSVKKLAFIVRYVLDWNNTQEMCNIVILEYDRTFIPDCYKDQKVCNKAVDNYPHTLEFVPDQYKAN